MTFLIFMTQCEEPKKSLEQIFDAEYEQHFISSGDNFQEISLFDNNRYQFLIGLHNGFQKQDIQKELNWSDKELESQIKILKENGYLKEENGTLFPSISIIMANEGQELFEQSEQIAETIATSIVEVEPLIKQRYSAMEISAKNPYEKFKFFLYSDVLLDNWQINNVEDDFLQKERTLRHGKRYYIQLAEKDSLVKTEVFGIYGNQYQCNDAACYITYGNNRVNNEKTLKELELMNIPILSKKDQSVLEEMAELYRPKLMSILTTNKSKFEKFYNQSVFKKELSFEEYFIWYYHFLTPKLLMY